MNLNFIEFKKEIYDDEEGEVEIIIEEKMLQVSELISY